MIGWETVRGNAKAPSSTSLVARVGSLFLALLTVDYAAKRADDADEGAAIRARISFGRALLIAAGPANHRVAFAEDLAHSDGLGRSVGDGRSAAPDR